MKEFVGMILRILMSLLKSINSNLMDLLKLFFFFFFKLRPVSKHQTLIQIIHNLHPVCVCYIGVVDFYEMYII